MSDGDSARVAAAVAVAGHSENDNDYYYDGDGDRNSGRNIIIKDRRKNNNTRSSFLPSLRRANHSGKIPVRLTLAQTSLSSAKPPQARHVLLSRQTFLHLGLEYAVRTLHEHALPTLSFASGIGTGNGIGNGTSDGSGGGYARTPPVKVVVQEDDDNGDDHHHHHHHHEDPNTVFGSESQTPTGDKIGDTTPPKGDASSDSRAINKINSNSDDEGSSVLESKEPSPYPVCWFEDVATQQPLRWQYFVGVLFDSLPQSRSQTLPWEIRLHFRSYPSQQLLELCDSSWGHPDGVLDTIKHAFRNSLKQGFVIRYGNSKEALNLSKQSHDAIWEGIVEGNYDDIAPVVYRDDEFEDEDAAATTATEPTTTTTTAAAVTITAAAASEIASIKIEPDTRNDADADVDEATIADDDADAHSNDDGSDTREVKNNEIPGPLGAPNETTTEDENMAVTTDLAKKESPQNKNRNRTNNLAMVPVRLSVDPTKPMIQKRCEGGRAVSEATLGSLLLAWAPSHFELVRAGACACADVETGTGTGKYTGIDTDKDEPQIRPTEQAQGQDEDEINAEASHDQGEVRPKGVTWRVAGLTPPLSTPLLDLWLALRHPDNFLYVSVVVEPRS